MQLTISKQFKTKESVNNVWNFLNDPYKVVKCVPGAKIVEEIDMDNYKGVILIKIGPITTEYNGDASIELRDKENLKLQITGKASATKGMGNASMTMTGNLNPLDDGGTEVSTSVNVTITGRVAQLGSRMIQAVSDKMFNEFVQNFEKNISKEETIPADASISETTVKSNVNSKSTTESQEDVKPISALSLISSVTPLYVKILVPFIIIVLIYLLLVLFGVLSSPI